MAAANNNIRNGILITVATAVIIAVLGFTFKNASLPRQEKEIQDIRLDIKDINTRQNADQLEKEIIKTDLKYTKESIEKIDKKIDRAVEDIMHQLREINKNTNENGRH
jgi:septal ring factor EnvC (AmiA/AmiB activator)